VGVFSYTVLILFLRYYGFSSLTRTVFFCMYTWSFVHKKTVTMPVSITSAVRIFEISNRIVTSVFDSKRAQLFEIFEYLPSPISYLTEWRRFFTLATMPSNQQNQQTWSRLRRLKTLKSTYYWWLLRPTITIGFDSKWKTLFAQHYRLLCHIN